MRSCPAFVLWLIFAAAPCAALAQGEAPLLEQKVRVGAPARELTIAVRSREHATLTVSGRQHELPTQNVSAASAETIQLTSRAAIALVRLRAENGEWAALVGGRQGNELLVVGRTDLHGDPGERRALAIEVGEPDERGERAVSFGTRHEGLTLCSNRAALPDRKRVDATTLTASAAAWRPEAPATAAATSTPGELPLLRALEPLGSSSLDPIGTPEPPRALLDRGPAGVSLEPLGFVTLRGAVAGLAIERLELRFAAAPQRPTELWVLGDDGRALHARLPDTGDAATLALEPAWPSRCLALVLGAGKQPGAVGLAELAAYTNVERAGGVEALVSRVVQGGAEAEQALAVLASLGPVGAHALAARFDALSARDRLRVLPLLARALEDQAVAARLLEAARSPELGEPAFAALSAAAERGKPLLRELSRDASERGDQAARLLSRDPAELPALLAALAHDESAGRPELRRVIANLAQRAVEPARSAFSAWLGEKPPLRARVALLLTLAPLDAFRQLAHEMAVPASSEVREFDDRYRLALAAAQLPASPELDAWLARELAATEWMMRHAAFAALDARGPAAAERFAGKAAQDAYPRVRAAALASLARGPGRSRVAELAQGDGWPLVRVAAVKALAPHGDQRPVLRKALEDGSHGVRAAAVEALAAQRASEAWPEVRAHLQSSSEWPDVREAAIDYATALCRTDAHEDLVALVKRGLRPDAADSDQALGAEAFEALLVLGGQAADDARRIASRQGDPPALKRLLERPPARCQPPRG